MKDTGRAWQVWIEAQTLFGQLALGAIGRSACSMMSQLIEIYSRVGCGDARPRLSGRPSMRPDRFVVAINLDVAQEQDVSELIPVGSAVVLIVGDATIEQWQKARRRLGDRVGWVCAVRDPLRLGREKQECPCVLSSHHVLVEVIGQNIRKADLLWEPLSRMSRDRYLRFSCLHDYLGGETCPIKRNELIRFDRRNKQGGLLHEGLVSFTRTRDTPHDALTSAVERIKRTAVVPVEVVTNYRETDERIAWSRAMIVEAWEVGVRRRDDRRKPTRKDTRHRQRG